MALSDDQKQDIVEWVSGHGTAVANGEVKRLVADDPEAAEFASTMRETRRFLQVPPTADVPLSDEEAEQIAANILERAGHQSPPPISKRTYPLRWLRTGAIAASLLLVVAGAWWMLAVDNRGHAGTVTLSRPYGAMGSSSVTETRSVSSGDTIHTEQRHAIIDLLSGTRVLLKEQARVIITDDGNGIIVEKGQVFIDNNSLSACYVGTATASLNRAQVLVSQNPDTYRWWLYKGEATISCDNRIYQAVAPQLIIWDRTAKEFTTRPLEPQIPGWASRMLRTSLQY